MIGDVLVEEDSEEDIIRCSMCKARIEDVRLLSPEVIARFYGWNVKVDNVGGEICRSFYCRRHSANEIDAFEEKGMAG